MGKSKNYSQEKIRYQLEVKNWYSSVYFGVLENYPKKLVDSKILCNSRLKVKCRVLSPEMQGVEYCNIEILGSGSYEAALRKGTLDEHIDDVGYFYKPRGGKVLEATIILPTHLYNSLHLSLTANKIAYVHIYGDKLKYGKGNIYDISFDTEFDDSDNGD